ncbi:MAG: hypothetical protein IJ709_08800, partial [Selenomonas sp.]|nr:hypothetical protein [Selenomonas sp.]
FSKEHEALCSDDDCWRRMLHGWILPVAICGGIFPAHFAAAVYGSAVCLLEYAGIYQLLGCIYAGTQRRAAGRNFVAQCGLCSGVHGTQRHIFAL